MMMMFGGRGLPGLPGFAPPPGFGGRGPVGRPLGAAALPQRHPPRRRSQRSARHRATDRRRAGAMCRISPASIQADNGAGLTKGIIGLVNKGQPRKPEDWGALRAWAWGAARALDYLETDPAVDAKKVGIEGVSRYGKAALVTMAFEPRFAVVLVGSSGEGGAKLHRRNFGEAVENLTGSGEYHWMAGNFLKYGAAEADLRQQERRRPSGRCARAHRALRAAADVHQLRRPREGRRELARPAGQLHGHGCRRPGLPPARREGPRRRPTTTGPRRCRR